MDIIDSIDDMQNRSLALRAEGKKIGFVPTMGCLHEGHLSLVDLIKDQADVCILSIFINPIQFGKNEDLNKYPETLDNDIARCRERGVDFVFMPKKEAIYSDEFSSKVIESILSDRLCGKSRPTHFDGVTTVCVKLFNICQPHYVALGQKDAQQVSVLKKIIKDLNFPIHIKVGPIIREMDGLAMSSLNTYLNPDERRDALLLNQSNELATRLVKSGINDVEIILKEIRELLTSVGSIKIDYVEIVNKHTLEDESIVISEQSMLMLAVWVNEVRLIDNKVL
jgi:pantoate--beta-alanine ligase